MMDGNNVIMSFPGSVWKSYLRLFLKICAVGFFYLSEEPVEFHTLFCSIAALNEAGSAIHIHQALVVIVINGGTEEPDVEPLSTGVVNILK